MRVCEQDLPTPSHQPVGHPFPLLHAAIAATDTDAAAHQVAATPTLPTPELMPVICSLAALPHLSILSFLMWLMAQSFSTADGLFQS